MSKRNEQISQMQIGSFEIPMDDDLTNFDLTANEMSKYGNWIETILEKFDEIEGWEIPPKQANLLVVYIKHSRNSTKLQQKIRQALMFGSNPICIVESDGETIVELQGL